MPTLRLIAPSIWLLNGKLLEHDLGHVDVRERAAKKDAFILRTVAPIGIPN